MARTLPDARLALIAAMTRDTPGTDLPRYVAVLDALIAWSVARPELLAFRTADNSNDALCFERVGTRTAVWTARAARGTGPRLEIDRTAGSSLSEDARADIIETLNTHARKGLVDGDRLQIGFGALKNDTARAAVLALMERLLTGTPQMATQESGAEA
jgi:hypothetical protein